MSLALHAGVFAAGLAIGAVAVTATSSPSTSRLPGPSAPAAKPEERQSKPNKLQDLVPRPDNGSLQRVNSTTAVEVLKYGFPGPVSDLLQRQAYVAAYDRQKRHPAWTAEHLTAANLGKSTAPALPLPSTASESATSSYAEALIKKQEERQQIPKGDRANSTFKEDPDVPELFRAKLEDYFRSGYDRGHMVPAADAKRSQEAMDETFLLTNIAPQVGDGFNRHYWAYVEDFCRRLTTPFSDVYVFTVPLYLPKQERDGKWRVTYEVIGPQAGGPPSVAVPTHFAKVILGARPANPATPLIMDTSIGAFVLPNAVIPDETPLEIFKVPVDAVEKAAGLSLFDSVTKATSKDLCRTVKCDVIVRRFDDAAKKGSRRNSTGSRQ
ncbi:hypothetical protein P389DRAFT_152976 [Cystobasidium minutum MCA 4210]|uniref:uncharacterized protein n=1 Tax=Cystobasidium minutum MCA 4210 TaxID=1397322 RepID=UPI0034CFA535|eukprot:jgi/Rhomi1/152976/estExt_Genewise1.C_4_t20488